MKKQFIAYAKCYPVKAYNGSMMTRDDTVVYLGESEGYAQLQTGRASAKRFETPAAAKAYALQSDGMPWYFQLKPGTLVIEDVSQEYKFWSKAELIAELTRRDNLASHTLYKRGDVGLPEAIRDGNGDVVLGLCRVCGRGEIELEQHNCREQKT